MTCRVRPSIVTVRVAVGDVVGDGLVVVDLRAELVVIDDLEVGAVLDRARRWARAGRAAA
jgi:hypothetical protein